MPSVLAVGWLLSFPAACIAQDPGQPTTTVASGGGQVAGAPASTTTSSSSSTTTSLPSEPKKIPLADTLSPWWALAIGLFGSLAYLVAVWVGMVSRGEDRDRILEYFKEWYGAKVLLYLSSGAAIAMIFQLPEGKLVPIQAFIIGCTWPAVVSNYLSGRQTGIPEAVKAQERQISAGTDAIDRSKSGLAQLAQAPAAAPPPDLTLQAALAAAAAKQQQAPAQATPQQQGPPKGSPPTQGTP